MEKIGILLMLLIPFLLIILLVYTPGIIISLLKKLFYPKRCPHCKSRIHKEATFCKYCRKEI